MTKDNKLTTIVFEGMDGAGKRTQTDLLAQVIQRKGFDVTMASFPKYECPTAYGVTEILKNDRIIDHEGSLKYTKILSYALNRAFSIFDKKDDRLYNTIKKGGVVLFDRYTTSSILHIASILDTTQEIDECINFIQDLEYDKLKFPKPDHVFFLDVHPDVSLKNIEKRGNEKDLNESPEHLYKVYEKLNYVVDKLGWTRMECTNSNMTMKSPLEIHFNICKHLDL